MKMRKKPLEIATTLVLIVLLALGLWAFAFEPNSIVTRNTTIPLHNWPPALERLRICLISDLHVGAPFISTGKLQRIVTLINESQPDLIVIAGDFVIQEVLGGSFVQPETIAGELKNLHARYGVYAVLGNHDWLYNGALVKNALTRAGIVMLDHNAVRIEDNGQALWLVGFGDLWMDNPDITATLAKVSDNAPIIAVTHNPDVFPRVPVTVSLTLAGHTHGGQVNLPLLGRRFVPSGYGARYAIGLIEENNHQLFVTAGVGTSILPVRFRVPPEISILTLTRKM
jgi:predicted MPP superfamily phosphohydrolase